MWYLLLSKQKREREREGGGGEKMKSEAASAETRIQPHSCSLATWKFAAAINRFMERSQLSNGRSFHARQSTDIPPAIASVMSVA